VFAALSADETFFDTAPMRLRETFEISLPAAEVWQELTAEHPLSWCRLLRDITWTSPRPFGVGTTRTARTVANGIVINERFFRWEEGRRKSFHVVEANVPFFRRFGEDYLIEPTAENACRFTWTIAVEARPAFRVANPLNRLMLASIFRDTRRHYAAR
jgi:hypothetical protein